MDVQHDSMAKGIPSEGAEPFEENPASHPRLDLKGTTCPVNYAKVKMRLEPLAPGEELEVLLDVGEPCRNVPASLRLDGHEIIQLDPVRNTEQYRMVVRKGTRAPPARNWMES